MINDAQNVAAGRITDSITRLISAWEKFHFQSMCPMSDCSLMTQRILTEQASRS